MRDEIATSIARAVTQDWKKIEVDLGDDFLDISVLSNANRAQIQGRLPFDHDRISNSIDYINNAYNIINWTIISLLG